MDEIGRRLIGFFELDDPGGLVGDRNTGDGHALIFQALPDHRLGNVMVPGIPGPGSDFGYARRKKNHGT